MTENTPLARAYFNIANLFEYRGLKTNWKPTKEEFDRIFRQGPFHFSTMATYVPPKTEEGEEERIIPSRVLFVYLLTKESKLFATSSSLLNIAADIANVHKVKKMTADHEIMILCEEAYQKEAKKHVNTIAATNGCYCHVQDWVKFITYVPMHSLVPVHEIATEEEIDRLRKQNYFEPHQCALIDSSDTMAVWLGLRPGMVVKVIRNNSETMFSVNYRFCL